jgi:hypothetical protein
MIRLSDDSNPGLLFHIPLNLLPCHDHIPHTSTPAYAVVTPVIDFQMTSLNNTIFSLACPLADPFLQDPPF